MNLCNFVALLLLTLQGSDAKADRVVSIHCNSEDSIDGTIYNYTLPDLHDVQNISLSDYQGKVSNNNAASFTLNQSKKKTTTTSSARIVRKNKSVGEFSIR